VPSSARDWYASQPVQPAAVTTADYAPVTPVAPPVPVAVAPGSSPYPSAFSRVDGRGEWRSLPADIDRRPPPAPPSPVYSNASSTYFIPPPEEWSAAAAPPPPPNHCTGEF